jgi:hypothetical protein
MGRATTAVGATVIAVAVAFGGIAAASGNKQLTKKQFIKQADKICKAFDDEQNQVAEQYFANTPQNQQPDPATITAFWTAIKPAFEQQIDDIRALREPKSDTKAIKRLLAAVEAGSKKVDADPPAALTGQPFAKADKLAKQYGFKICGSENA